MIHHVLLTSSQYIRDLWGFEPTFSIRSTLHMETGMLGFFSCLLRPLMPGPQLLSHLSHSPHGVVAHFSISETDQYKQEAFRGQNHLQILCIHVLLKSMLLLHLSHSPHSVVAHFSISGRDKYKFNSTYSY